MRFLIKNSDLFLLPGNPHMLHLATIGYGLREFVAFVCIKNPPLSELNGVSYVGNCYIEEAVLESKDLTHDVFAHLKFIDDNSLAHDLAKFATEHNILNIPEQLNKIATYPKYRHIFTQLSNNLA